ncbi:MAG TPA: hypothetical protein VGM92_06160 [Candidatus Kapabacteria bacterium]
MLSSFPHFIESHSTFSSDWTFDRSFDRSGAYQMERDEALARERITNSKLPSVLRLYSWQPPAVSIGYQQKIETIDSNACNERGIDIVRRPTGGRAVLHYNELTYAVITRAHPADGLYAVHNRIVTALVESIQSMSSSSSTDKSALTVTPHAGTEKTALPVACFASVARHEVSWNGKKVIGSAQRRFGDVVLQHGSILLTEDHLLLPELLALAPEEKSRMQNLLERETATLAEVFGRTISILECAEAIRTHFRMPEMTLRAPDPLLSIT